MLYTYSLYPYHNCFDKVFVIFLITLFLPMTEISGNKPTNNLYNFYFIFENISGGGPNLPKGTILPGQFGLESLSCLGRSDGGVLLAGSPYRLWHRSSTLAYIYCTCTCVWDIGLAFLSPKSTCLVEFAGLFCSAVQCRYQPQNIFNFFSSRYL